MGSAVAAAVKRRAIRALHRTPAGEALLLNVYLWAEEGAEATVLVDALAGGLPDWLVSQVERHASDEARHAALLRARLADLGAIVRAPRVDPISRWKLRRLRLLAERARPRFRAGIAVPLFAIAERMEAMGVRVLDRHVGVLADGDPTRALLARIVTDERHHVRACARALAALVGPDERPALAALRRRIAAVERSFDLVGALGLLAAGVALQVLR